MTPELPILQLGLAGFTVEQQRRLEEVLGTLKTSGTIWAVSDFGDADAWCVSGARTQVLADGTLRVAAGVPGGRSIQLDLQEIDRPVAFALPLAPRNFEPVHIFDVNDSASVKQLLDRLESWLRPLVAQFCLASQILEHEAALGGGTYHVVGTHGTLLAVVNLRGDVAVLPTAGPLDFDHAMWTPRPTQTCAAPEGFLRASLSLLMWQYALRTRRDVLPKRYRIDTLYFRRPPRLPQRLLRDSHLLLLRELAFAPARFKELAQRCGLSADALAQDLAALYLVGAVTSNPRRASLTGVRRHDAVDSVQNASHSVMPSGLGSDSPSAVVTRRLPAQDLTAPAPISFE